jgi:hypothetical protein
VINEIMVAVYLFLLFFVLKKGIRQAIRKEEKIIKRFLLTVSFI